MSTAIRSWRQSRRFQAIVRQLKALPPRELQLLGIDPSEFTRLALAAARF